MIFGSLYHRITEQLATRERVLFDHFVREEMSTDEVAGIFYGDSKKVVKSAVRRNKRRIKKDIVETMKVLNTLFLKRATERASLLTEAMKSYGRKDVYDIIFPKALTEYSIVSRELNLAGRVDRIEERDGRYYPVEIKTGGSKRYSEKDLLQLAGYGILIEKKFNSPVDKGFIEYVVQNTKKEVAIDAPLRDRFFQLKDAVEQILDGIVPKKERRSECEFCNFRTVCWER
jgi:CRISPR-associated protein Cas4